MQPHRARRAAPAPVRWFVLDADAIAHADATGLDALIDLAQHLHRDGTDDLDVPAAEALLLLATRLAEAGIPLALARVHGSTIEMLEKVGVVGVLGRERVGGRVEDAVHSLEAP